MAKGKKGKHSKKSNVKSKTKSSSNKEHKESKQTEKSKLKEKDRPKPKKNSGDNDFRKLLEGDDTRIINEMAEDGNCLFRSLSDQLYRDYGEKHDKVRSEICDYLKENKESFQSFVVLDEEDDADHSDEYASSYEEYLNRMRQEGEWGGNPELVAAARLYR